MENENIFRKIEECSEQMDGELRAIRRDIHMYPEVGFEEVRTSSIIAEKLNNMGYEVLIGDQVMKRESRMGKPDEEVLEREYERAVRQGANLTYAEKMKNGMTGVIGVLKCGKGPVVALRFDIDALYVNEADDCGHRPEIEGFASVNKGIMHACGHDGHTAIGLGVARVLMEIREKLNGTVKLIFQPAEEGVRGAKAVVDRGSLDDVGYLLSAHIDSANENEAVIVPGSFGGLATTKLDVYFKGRSAHAGAYPQDGRNVIQAMAAAISNLYAIPRTSLGSSRINVGTISAGTGRNVIADFGKMEMEVRGETAKINSYMNEYAERIIKAAAEMYGVSCEIKKMGEASVINSDKEMIELVKDVCTNNLRNIKLSETDSMYFNGSEDISYMMDRVQQNGGVATFMRILSPLKDVLHGSRFDYDEGVLKEGVKVFAATVYRIMSDNI